jgi:hypothetical protein
VRWRNYYVRTDLINDYIRLARAGVRGLRALASSRAAA